MGQLNLALLGSPAIDDDSRAITFATRKSLALLVYLAVEGGWHTRAHITAIFWPESDAEQGRTSMRKTLAYLRQALDNHASLLVERERLSLDPASAVEVDVWALQAAARAIRQPPLASSSGMASLPSAQIHRLLEPLQRAVDLYRGDFLAGFSLSDAPTFDDWASLQRENCHRQASLVFDRLSQAQFESGDLRRAIDTAIRWCGHDPLDEATYRRLMQLHFANGDRTAALQTYAACQTVLARELDVEPSPETEALATRLRAVNLRSNESQPNRSSKIENRQSADSPLVGRAFEHMQLVNAYHTARQSGLQITTLEGEPGIGKSRLANEFLTWASAQGANIYQSRAFEAGGRLPYQPVVEALRPTFALQPTAFHLLSPLWLAELSRLLPELVDHLPTIQSQSAGGEAQARSRLFEAIVRLGQALVEPAPLILFIDDLQWADAASLEVLHYVARRWAAERLPVLLLFALRTENLATSPYLIDWLNALRRDAPVIRLTLSMLTLEDTQQLMQALVGLLAEDRKPGSDLLSSVAALRSFEQFSQRLFTETKGQPFFIVQTVRSLLERGLWQSTESGEWRFEFDSEIPGTVRDLIQARLASLSPVAQSCCASGAVLGDGFAFGLLCRVAGLSETEALPGVEELLARGLLREAQSAGETPGPPIYFFTHDRIREVAYTQLSQARRHLLHRGALAALTDAGGSRSTAMPPAPLARHALLAGLAGMAFHYSVEAGEAALGMFAVDDAIEHFAQAWRLWQSGDLTGAAGLPDRVFSMYQRLGRAYELSNQLAQAGEVYRAMLALARDQHKPVMECVALNRLATALSQTYRAGSEQPLALLQEALQVAESSGNLNGLAETEWNIAQHCFYRADAITALPHAERALALARELGQKELIARALNILAYLKGQWLAWDESVACAEEARLLYAALGERTLQVDCLCLIAQARLSLGQPTAAMEAARSALVIAQEIENPWGQVNSALQLALGLVETGDYPAALELAQQAATAGRASDLAVLLCIAHLVLGNVYVALDDREAAQAAHWEAARINGAMTWQPFSAPVAAALCSDYALAGEWEAAYLWAGKFLETRESSLDFHAGFTFWRLVETWLRAGEMERAREETWRFGGLVGDNPRYCIPYLRAQAVLAAWEDAGAQAIVYWEEANRLAGQIGLPGEHRSILAMGEKLHQVKGDSV